jgi:hypothetical protein
MSLFCRASVLLLTVAATAVAAESTGGSTLSKVNVFAPSGSAAAAQAAAHETIEFAGISTMGKHTELIFVDKNTKKNFWIAKGETKEGITVLNYDSKREEAVVTINGAQKTLPLKQVATSKPGATVRAVPAVPTGFNVAPQPPLPPVAVPGSAPVSVTPAVVTPAPVSPAPAPTPKPEQPTTPEGVAKAETEARMLVSDLLEIGMAQRKAYEEAQRKAAEGKTEPSPQPNSATPETPKP